MCGAGYYEYEYQWRADIPAMQDSGGFVETEDMQEEFPVTVTVYSRTHMTKDASSFVRISNVREDSIAVEERKGVRTLVFESVVTDRIGYVPFVEWYTTEVQTKTYGYGEEE